MQVQQVRPMVHLSLPISPFARRMLLALVAAAILVSALPQAADAAPFGVQKLRQGSSSGAENYIYTDGGSVVGQATVDSGTYYRFTVLDSSATVRSSSACTQSLLK